MEQSRDERSRRCRQNNNFSGRICRKGSGSGGLPSYYPHKMALCPPRASLAVQGGAIVAGCATNAGRPLLLLTHFPRARTTAPFHTSSHAAVDRIHGRGRRSTEALEGENLPWALSELGCRGRPDDRGREQYRFGDRGHRLVRENTRSIIFNSKPCLQPVAPHPQPLKFGSSPSVDDGEWPGLIAV